VGGRPWLPGSGGVWPGNSLKPTVVSASNGLPSWRAGPLRELRGLHRMRGWEKEERREGNGKGGERPLSHRRRDV